MKKEKQTLIHECFYAGRYSIEGENLYTTNLQGVKKLIKGTTLPTGYKQHNLFNRKRGKKAKMVRAYFHHIVYLCRHPVRAEYYPETWVIDHIDRNCRNNDIRNLCAMPVYLNTQNTTQVDKYANGIRTIRGNEIAEIRMLHSEGLSQSAIARQLNLNRLSVRRTVKKIERGEELKYENYTPSPTPPVHE